MAALPGAAAGFDISGQNFLVVIGDNTAMNGVEFSCSQGGQRILFEGYWGGWEPSLHLCPDGFSGLAAKFELFLVLKFESLKVNSRSCLTFFLSRLYSQVIRTSAPTRGAKLRTFHLMIGSQKVEFKLKTFHFSQWQARAL